MMNPQKRAILSEVALRNVPPDIVITNGTVFNVFTREFIKRQSIWIKDGAIAYVGPEQDPPRDKKIQLIQAEGRVVLPGLIDGHTHLNKSSIEEFVRHVIPSGTTAVVMEMIKFGMISGKEGLEAVVKGFEGQPIRFYFTVPPLCGLTPSIEVKVPTNEELLPLLRDPKCLGIGEVFWGNILSHGRQGERMRELVAMALEMGKRVEGHTAGAAGRKLQAYACFGISSCHEPITEREVLERLRLGYWTMIRQGGIRKELPAVKGIFEKEIDFRRLILATDTMDPQGFMEEGYLDAGVRTALKLGIPPGVVYQMVTINVAEHFHLDHLIGSLSPGRMADLLIIPRPEEFSPQMVMCGGRIIFEGGTAKAEPKEIFFPDQILNTVKVQDFAFPPIPKRGKVRVMELVSRLVTQEKVIDLEDPVDSQDIIMALALDRVGGGGAFMGLLKGFGLERGAYGSSTCWDTIDMIVVGCDRRSMKTVIERLCEIGGGCAYAIGSEIVAESPAPLFGSNSVKPMETVGAELKSLEEVLRRNGVKWEKPLLSIDTLTTAAIPYLRLTHQGYVRIKDRKILSLEAEIK